MRWISYMAPSRLGGNVGTELWTTATASGTYGVRVLTCCTISGEKGCNLFDAVSVWIPSLYFRHGIWLDPMIFRGCANA